MFKTKICHFELIWLQTTLQVHMFTEHIRLCNWQGIEWYLIHVVIQIRLQRVFWLEVLQCYSVSFNFVAPICSFNLLLCLIFTRRSILLLFSLHWYLLPTLANDAIFSYSVLYSCSFWHLHGSSVIFILFYLFVS